MLLRISLFVALVAAIGALFISHTKVAPRIETLTTERDAATTSATQANEKASKATADAKKARQDLEAANANLATVVTERDEINRQLGEQKTRAQQQFEQLTNVTKERNEAQQQLAAYKATQVEPHQIAAQRDQLLKAIAERDTFISENKILLTRIKVLERELARYTEGQEVEVPMPTGLKGKIVAVDPKFDFVVLDIGGNQGVAEGGKMLVNRDGKLVAKVRITRVEPNRSIANIMPDWKQEEVLEGDQVIY